MKKEDRMAWIMGMKKEDRKAWIAAAKVEKEKLRAKRSRDVTDVKEEPSTPHRHFSTSLPRDGNGLQHAVVKAESNTDHAPSSRNGKKHEKEKGDGYHVEEDVTRTKKPKQDDASKNNTWWAVHGPNLQEVTSSKTRAKELSDGVRAVDGICTVHRGYGTKEAAVAGLQNMKEEAKNKVKPLQAKDYVPKGPREKNPYKTAKKPNKRFTWYSVIDGPDGPAIYYGWEKAGGNTQGKTSNFKGHYCDQVAMKWLNWEGVPSKDVRVFE